MRHLQAMIVQIDNSRARLAPGAQIRDAQNRLVLPTAIPAGSLVKYQWDAQGMVERVWILTPEEAAQPASTR
jgi:anti-sigma factor ChrR (cupin superfamily)